MLKILKPVQVRVVTVMNPNIDFSNMYYFIYMMLQTKQKLIHVHLLVVLLITYIHKSNAKVKFSLNVICKCSKPCS